MLRFNHTLSLQDQIQSSIVSSGCVYTPWLKRKIKEINLVALPSDTKTMFWPRSNQKVAPGAKSLVFWVSMFFAGLKDAVLWQRVLGVGN